MKELADSKNQFHTLSNRIGRIPQLKDKSTKELLKRKRTQIYVNEETINLKDSNHIVIEVI